MTKIIAFLTAFFILTYSYAQTYSSNGMVVSDNIEASKIGVDILKKGGNAIDASIATAFALAVVHPQAGNIGGGGFMVYLNESSEVTTIDFREMAPIMASPTMFLDDNGQLIEGSNHNGALSIGVPGTVAGLYMDHQKYGKLPWKELVQPSIDLAQNGVILSFALASHAQGIQGSNVPDFLKNLYLGDNGKPLKQGDLWKQPELANTLMLIRDHGKDGFYKGVVAEEIERYMRENGGIITKDDLLEYEAVERSPIRGTYNGYEIYSMAPPSSGGVALIEMLNIMEQANLDTIAFNSTEYVHLVAEAMRRAFADRAEHLGDPDFNPNMPIDKLTSKEFAAQRLKNIDMKHASVSDSSRFGQLYDGTNTTHFSVIDKDGNSVSVTYTLEQSYGSGMGSEKLGFIFNNEMGDFNPQPGYTNSGWLIGTDPNLIAPKKRMLSSMTPTIVTKDGQPVLIIGSPGGRTIINTVFQTVLCFLEYNMEVDEAIEAMKIHHQWLPNKLVYEEHKLSPDTVEALKEMGHTVQVREALGRLMGISVDFENRVYVGASDSSSPDGGAVGY
jgi:gamma-glutamyltranspeptidase/glutathione hydrolase